MRRVVITGATGYLGQYLIRAFKKSEYAVVVLVRNPSKLTHIARYIDEIHKVDILNPLSLRKIIRADDMVVSTVGITRQKDNLTYMDVDYGANMNILEAAIEAKASKFMYISALKGDQLTQIKICRAKEKFVRALESSSIDSYVIRPTGFFVDIEEIFKMAKNRRVYQFAKGAFQSNPIHGQDLANFCVDVGQNRPGSYDVGGPEVFSADEIARLAFKVLDKKPKISNIPLWIAKVVKWCLSHFTKQTFHGPLEFFLTVMCMDMVGPTYGEHRLEDHFKGLK